MVLPAIVSGLLSGCGGGGSSSTVAVPTTFTGSASGTIVDSRGNPIAGALVSYDGSSGVSIRTSTSGAFTLTGISVSGVSVASGSAITLQVVPPAAPTKYMTASINAVPKAQLNASSTPSLSSTFSINVGTVQVPAMADTVSAVLLDSSQAPIANKQLGLAFVASNFAKNAPPSGVTVTLNPSSVDPVTTGSDGSFKFKQVYNDACLRINFSGYTISTASASVPICPASTATATTDPSTLQFTTGNLTPPDGVNGTLTLGVISATAISTGQDTIAPYVAAVEGALDTTSVPQPLSSAVTGTCSTLADGSISGGIVVDFSEPMASNANASAAPSVSTVQVVSGTVSAPTPQALQSVQLINNNTQLQICTASALPVAATFVVEILRQVLLDSSGNLLVVTGANAAPYAGFATTPSGASVLAISLKTTSSSF